MPLDQPRPGAELPMAVQGQRAMPAVPPGMAAQDSAIKAATATPMPDGGAMLELPGPAPAPRMAEAGDHDENLAADLDDTDLAQIAAEVLEGVEADLQSNEGYYESIRSGIKLLGLTVETCDDPFPGASGAIHPMLLIALVRFVANARAELQPAGGPASCKTEATPAPAVEAKAHRKERYLNYYLTTEDRGYYRDCDAGWLQLGIHGSIFRKVFDDPVSGKPRSRYLTPEQLLVSYHAPDLESAIRTTHIDTISTSEAVRRCLSGYYVEDAEFRDTDQAEDTPQAKFAETGQERQRSDREEDAEQVHLHSHVLLDPAEYSLPSEDAPDGLPLPYVVTVDRRTEKVLRIERDWLPDDPLFSRRDTYAHYLMHPGLGFYGWSLITLMASTTNTASVLWRQAINTFLLHTFPGGLRVKGMRPESESLSMGPGEFAEIDTGGLPIAAAVMPLPYRDLPASFPALFETVVTQGQTLGGTQELQVGEGRQDAPVGTTLALLDAAIKPTAAVFKRLHEAQGHELQMIAGRFGRQQGATYPYLVDGQRGQALAADFADNADVVPVSDPNIPTQTQRLAQSQAVLQLAMASGGIMDPKAALEDMLVTMGRSPQEIARLMPKPNQGKPEDVALELAKVLKGEPLAVGPTQDHDAHVRSHLPLMSVEGLPPNVASALLAHIGEHVAAWYRIQAEQAALSQGLQLPPPGQPMPPEIEAAMARAVAANSESIVAKLGGMLGGAGADPAKAAEIAFKLKELEWKGRDSDRKAEETARQDQTELLKLRQESLDGAADRALKERELEVKIQAEVVKALGAAHSQQATGAQRLQQMGADHKHKASFRANEMQHELGMSQNAAGQAQRQAQADRDHKTSAAKDDRRQQTGIAALTHMAGLAKQGQGADQAMASQESTQAHDMAQAALQAEQERQTQTANAAQAKAADERSGRQASATQARDHAFKARTQQVAGKQTLAAIKAKPKPAAKPAAKKAGK